MASDRDLSGLTCITAINEEGLWYDPRNSCESAVSRFLFLHPRHAPITLYN